MGRTSTEAGHHFGGLQLGPGTCRRWGLTGRHGRAVATAENLEACPMKMLASGVSLDQCGGL
jgi:hypothetical protein